MSLSMPEDLIHVIHFIKVYSRNKHATCLEEISQAAIKLLSFNWHLLVLLDQVWAQHLHQILDPVQEVRRESLIPVHLHYDSPHR
jgi:hypothetical protein